MIPVDLRIVFADACVELLRQSTIENITVRQVLEQAGLSARSFYNYFRDKYDLISFVYFRFNEQCWFDEGRFCPFEETSTRFVSVIQAHSSEFRNMYAYSGQNDLRSFMLKKTASDIMRLFICNGLEKLEIDVDKAKTTALTIAFGLNGSFELMADRNTRYPISYSTLKEIISSPWKELLYDDPSAEGKTSGRYVIPFNAARIPWPPKLYI